MFEILFTGQIKSDVTNEKQREIFEEVIKNFTIPARLAKEVAERGEFINIITSDLVSSEEHFALLNRIRRVDGEEFLFMSDPQNTVHLVSHFVGRLYELVKNPKVKDELDPFKKELSLLGERLKQLSI